MATDVPANCRSTRAATPTRRLAPLAAAIALCFVGAASAATITVNSDSGGSVAGSCTLFDAVTSINQGSLVATSNCANASGAGGFGSNDTINFSLPLPATITFEAAISGTNSALVLMKAATISGDVDVNGKPLVTIQRGANVAHFRLIETQHDLALSGIRLMHGYLYSSDSGNTNGGALYAKGPSIDAPTAITVTNSEMDQNTAGIGGGILVVYSTLTLVNSTVSHNSAANGGGVAVVMGAMVATGSTFYYNSAHNHGGGIMARTNSPKGQLKLTDSTLSQNLGAYGGAIYANGVTLDFCTVTNNHAYGNHLAHVYNSGSGILLAEGQPAIINATLVSQNWDKTTNPYLFNDIATHFNYTSKVYGDYSVISALSPAVTIASNNGTHNKNCDPGLGWGLNDNGGPTQTRALGSGSCAIDAGPITPPGNLPWDQRGPGHPRKVGRATDIGAYELNDDIFYNGFEPPDRIFYSGFDP